MGHGCDQSLHVSDKELLFDAMERNMILSCHDALGNIVSVNRRFCALFGAFKGDKPSINPLQDDGQQLSSELLALLEAGETWRGRKSYLLEQRREVIVDVTAIPILNPHLSEILVMIEDVTSVVLAGRLQQQKQVQHKIDRLMQQKRHHQEIGRIKDTFLMLFTHELRTPLNAVINFSRHLLKHLAQIEHTKAALMREEARLTMQSGEQMMEMIENMTLAIRLRDHSFALHPELIECHTLVDWVAERFDSEAVSLQIDIDPKLSIQSDHHAMRSILYNLISNTIKYGEGKVRITCRGDGEYFILEIGDNGLGFRHLEGRLFDLFEQSDADVMTRRDQGAGVGMYVVKKLCDLQDYSVTLGIDPGGAQVQIYGEQKGLHVSDSDS